MGNCLSIFQSIFQSSESTDAIESISEVCEELETVEEIDPLISLRENQLHNMNTPSEAGSSNPEFWLIESMKKPCEEIDRVERIDPLIGFIENHLQKMNTPSEAGSSNPVGWLIESIRKTCEDIDTVEQIDQLISFIENQLDKMITPSEAGSSNSEGWIETVRVCTKFAETIMDKISTENVSKSEVVEEMRTLTLKVVKGVGDLRVFIALSVAAFAIQSYISVSSTMENKCKCRELFMKILELAKEVKLYSEQMPDDREKLSNAVSTIVEGAVICCDCLKNNSRFWSPTTAAAQLKKTNQQLGKEYGGKDVFLCHSGYQKNFVRQLHRDLTRDHVSCFFDQDDTSLPLGEKFPPLIFKDAATCKIALVVVSKEFIRSKWPMTELSAFISARNSGKNAKLKLLPIFFNISPNELLNELSHITNSPEWKKFVENNERRDKWRDALKEVQTTNGLTLGYGGNEVECRDNAVEIICSLLKGTNRPKLLDFKPVGIEEQVEDVRKLLDMKGAHSALVVIVYGFGGVGKTTLAGSVVESLDWSSRDFKFCSVAIDEKNPDKASHIIELQKNIISKLGGVKLASLDFQDPCEGRSNIKEVLKKKCSLILIDNVVDKDYIRDLLPRDLQTGDQETKLRIIVTSRESNVKVELNPNIMCYEYEVKSLSDTVSESLLKEIILQSQVVTDEDEERMINEVAAACRGVPLLLSTFGKHLRWERNKDSYQEALDVLREGNLYSYRDEDLGKTLMFVYDKIKDEEVQETYLDICTYFHGWGWDVVLDIVDSPKLEDLHRRALVSKSGSGEVIVHDILRLMGMKKAELTRFLNYKQLSDALEDGVGNVKGISLVSDNRLITIQSTQLEAMRLSLRVLMLGDWVTIDGQPSDKAFRNLRYLSVGDITAFPFEYPSKLEKLRVFLNRSKPGMNLSQLPSSLKRISHEVPDVECDEFAKLPFQNLSCLKSFIVKTRKAVELPDELHLPASLVHLDLSRCQNVPEDVGHLTALESLILDRSDLKCLPQGIGKLKKLKHLSMNYCLKLTSLPEEFGMLSSLEALSKNNCENLTALPQGIGELRISSLQLDSLVNLTWLPNSFGNMPLLKDVSLKSCHSLVSLPDSFVQLKMLETLKIIECTKLSNLPKDFGRLRYLKHMTVEECHLLKELPPGFGALPSLKIFEFNNCKSFVNLPRDFAELTGLEDLVLRDLFISRIPDGFGKLKSLRFLKILGCFELKTLSDDFENLAALERLEIRWCPRLDGAVMEKIVRLQHCYKADITHSEKLLEKWRDIRSEIEHPIFVQSYYPSERDEVNLDKGHAMRVALLNGKCVEVHNSTGELMERSSLLEGMIEGTIATVAFILLPIKKKSHHHEALKRFVESATAKSNGSGKLQIVCARQYDVWTDQRPTPTEEEERAEEDDIREILLSLPKGSCAIPSAQSKRVKIITSCCDTYLYDRLCFFTANVGPDIEGRKRFVDFKFSEEKEYSGNEESFVFSKSILGRALLAGRPHEILTFPRNLSICKESVKGKSKTREFVDALKSEGIYYLHTENRTNKVMVDDLQGKTIGFIICRLEFFECIKLQQIYQDFQQKDSNFILIWIPSYRRWSEELGHGSYTRLIQCMPWATFPNPQLVEIRELQSTDRWFVVLDKEGEIANHDALPLLLAWGAKLYPFTQHTIPESFWMESESCLEFLLQGMNIAGRKPMKSKMTFLYAGRSRALRNMKCKLEQLTLMDGNVEVLHVGPSVSRYEMKYLNLKQDYEDGTQNMRWPSLSFSDMIMFWNRCLDLADRLNRESNIKMKTVPGLAGLVSLLYGIGDRPFLVLIDKDGVVTRGGYDAVQMICDSSDGISEGEKMVVEELKKSLSRGECTPLVKTFFGHEIDNHPLHPQHRITSFGLRWWETCTGTCSVCDVRFRWEISKWDQERAYECFECDWKMCASCWKANATLQAQQLLPAQTEFPL